MAVDGPAPPDTGTDTARPVRAAGRPAADHQVLLLLDADTGADLRGRVADLAGRVGTAGGLDDLAATLQRRLADRPVRAGVVADSADQARDRLTRLAAALRRDGAATLDVDHGVFAGRAAGPPVIGYLFPGQGAGVGTGTTALRRRFEPARELYRTVPVPTGEHPGGLGAAQQRIVASSVAGLRVLSLLGIEASAAAGHSLGELTALHWAGAMGESALIALAGAHGRAVAGTDDGGGTMARIAAGPDQVEPLLLGEPVVITGYNSPVQTVVSGPVDAVGRVRLAAVAAGLPADLLPVGKALHSPAMAPAADGLRAHLAGLRLRTPGRSVVSTTTGDVLPPGTDLRGLLLGQVSRPVRFSQAVGRLAAGAGLLVEVGPDRTLSLLAAQICPDVPVVPLDTDGPSSAGVLSAAAAAWVLGAPVRHDRLVAGSPAR